MFDQANAGNDAAVLKAQQDAGNLSRMQKAAIIIALLGAENAKPLIESIEERHMRSFVQAMQTLQLVPRPVLLATVADFITNMNARNGSFRGGEEQARQLATELLDTERANRLFSAPILSAEGNSTDAIWDKLAEEKPDVIADYLNTKRPEVTNIILSNLSPIKAGEILGEMSDEAAEAAGHMMAEGSDADDITKAAIAEVVEIEFMAEGSVDENAEAASFMSDVMGVLPRNRRDRLMDIIEESNPEQAERIRRGLLTFEDLPVRLPKTAIPMIFRDMDNKTLLQALKAGEGSEPMTTGFLFGNISQRMAEQYKEDMAALPSMTEKEGEGAIIALMAFISGLERAGTIAYIEVADDSDTSMAAFEMDLDLPVMEAEDAEGE